MIRQPLGCILVVLIFSLSVGLAVALPLLTHVFFPGHIVVVLAVLLCLIGVFPLFFVLMDFSHKMEIRYFCKKWGLEIVESKKHRNHFGVKYVEAGQQKYGKWPDEFEVYANGHEDIPDEA